MGEILTLEAREEAILRKIGDVRDVKSLLAAMALDAKARKHIEKAIKILAREECLTRAEGKAISKIASTYTTKLSKSEYIDPRVLDNMIPAFQRIHDACSTAIKQLEIILQKEL